MKIVFFNNQKDVTTYTHELLKFLAQKNGHELCDMANAEIIGVSLTSHYEIEDLKRVRKQFPNKKIIAGGHASNAPAPLLRWADYVNCGQGFEFFQDCKSIEDIESQDYIATREKEKIRYSQLINWGSLPVIQISKNSWSYLESVGCKHKCKFCLTSWMNKFQQNPNKNKIKSIEKKLKGKQLYLVGNNYDNVNIGLKVSDVTIKGFIKKPCFYKNIKLIRAGIESPVYETRKYLSKNIKDDHLKEFFEVTKQMKKQCNLFFIAGLDDQEKWESFMEILPSDTMGTSPSIGVVINYIDPSLITPLEKFDMTKVIPINIPKIKRLWKLHNGRIRIYRDHKISWKMNLLDCMMQRCHWSEIEKILKFKKVVYQEYEKLLDDIEKAGLFHLVTGNHEKYFQIA